MKYLTMILMCIMMVGCEEPQYEINKADSVTFKQFPDTTGTVLWCDHFYTSGRECMVRFRENGAIKTDLFSDFELEKQTN